MLNLDRLQAFTEHYEGLSNFSKAFIASSGGIHTGGGGIHTGGDGQVGDKIKAGYCDTEECFACFVRKRVFLALDKAREAGQ